MDVNSSGNTIRSARKTGDKVMALKYLFYSIDVSYPVIFLFWLIVGLHLLVFEFGSGTGYC